MTDIIVGLLLIIFGTWGLIAGIHYLDVGLWVMLVIVLLSGLALITCRSIMIIGKPKTWAIWLGKH